MRRYLFALALFGLAGSTVVRTDGLLIPTDRTLPPLRLSYQRVEVAIDAQVATTTVEQSYHNTTDRDLEAEYIFPLPAGARFAISRCGSTASGTKAKRLIRATARQTYEDIVPPLARSRPARIYRSRPLESTDLPRAPQRLSEDPDHLHVDLASRGRHDLL